MALDVDTSAVPSYHRALMVTHQGCPQTPGGRIRALGFARMGARRRSPRYQRHGSLSRAVGLTSNWVLRPVRRDAVAVRWQEDFWNDRRPHVRRGGCDGGTPGGRRPTLADPQGSP